MRRLCFSRPLLTRSDAYSPRSASQFLLRCAAVLVGQRHLLCRDRGARHHGVQGSGLRVLREVGQASQPRMASSSPCTTSLNMDEIKRTMNVPTALQSCHTAVVDRYVIEGHVPADVIKKILRRKAAGAGTRRAGNADRVRRAWKAESRSLRRHRVRPRTERRASTRSARRTAATAYKSLAGVRSCSPVSRPLDFGIAGTPHRLSRSSS